MSDSEMLDELLADARERMTKSVDSIRHEFGSVRTGRASPALLDRISVDYYGAATPLKQLATISAPEARLLTIQPYDKGSIKAIERAILESDIGLTPANDGNLIRLGVPELTEERRKQLVKVVRQIAEEGRVAIRNIRRDVMHDLRELKEAGEAGSDDEHRAELELQKVTDADQRARRAAQAQGRRDPRGVSDLAGRRAGAQRARYVAIITDGNGRWAQRRGLPVVAGHEAGADTVKARLRDAVELGIKELTVYSFSTENWSRSEEEVSALMAMFERRIEAETPELHEQGVRMRFIGRRARPGARALVERMEWAEELTRDNTRITLFVAFDYGGRAEIVDAARTFTGGDEDAFRAHLYAPDMHDPDLIIRTSGEQRISNYLLWQGPTRSSCSARAVARLLAEAFAQRLEEFAARKRRFGGR